MKRELLATTAALTATLAVASGCGENAPVTSNPAAPRAQEAAVATCTEPTRAPWEAITTQPDLPCAIGAITAHAVEFDITLSRKQVGASEQTEKTGGSGTIVNYKGMKIVIGSAHVGEQATASCNDQKIFVPPTNEGEAREPSAVTITAASAIPAGQNYNSLRSGFDANIVVPAAGTLGAHPGLKVQEAPTLEPGDTVFAMGYGMRWDQKVDPSPMSYEPDHQKPVVITGSVLTVTAANKVVFAVNTQGYEPVRDDSLRKGDSGGPTVDGNGNYLGGVALNIGTMPGAEIEQSYGVDLPGGTEAIEYRLSVAQLVKAADVDTMLASTVLCK